MSMDNQEKMNENIPVEKLPLANEWEENTPLTDEDLDNVQGGITTILPPPK